MRLLGDYSHLPDPVAAALDKIESMFASKNDDYTTGSWSSNFQMSAQAMGCRPVDVADTLIAVKQARLAALRANGRPPKNESVIDTYVDRAVYAVIALSLLVEEGVEL